MTDGSPPTEHPRAVGDDLAGSMAGIRAKLLARYDADQNARHAHTAADERGEADWSTIAEVDNANLAFLEPLIEAHGWLGSDLVGEDGAHAGWLLVQQAPDDHQQRWLPLLRAAVQAGTATERELAYLQDRVDTHRGHRQRWGTQSLGFGRGVVRLWPVADPAGLNARRVRLDLAPITPEQLANAWTVEQLAQHGITVLDDPDHAEF